MNLCPSCGVPLNAMHRPGCAVSLGRLTAAGAPTTPLATQIAGDHYKKLKIQPVEYIHANGIGFFEGNVIKYVTRWRDKGGVEDLKKARHFIDLLLDLEGRK